jgi:CheY-like chemotaxis protein
VTPRILISEPNDDVRALLELIVRRLGYHAVAADDEAAAPVDVDAMLLEPACEVGQATLDSYGEAAPPVVCLSVYPREEGLEPSGSVAYLLKPASTASIAEALAAALAA